MENRNGINKPKVENILNLYNMIDPIVKLIAVTNILIVPIITSAVKYSVFVKGDAKRFNIFLFHISSIKFIEISRCG